MARRRNNQATLWINILDLLLHNIPLMDAISDELSRTHEGYKGLEFSSDDIHPNKAATNSKELAFDVAYDYEDCPMPSDDELEGKDTPMPMMIQRAFSSI